MGNVGPSPRRNGTMKKSSHAKTTDTFSAKENSRSVINKYMLTRYMYLKPALIVINPRIWAFFANFPPNPSNFVDNC
jgi:hypothetical protein